MAEAESRVIYLENYQPPTFLVEAVDLSFFLEEEEVTVVATLQCYKNPNSLAVNNNGLVLYGEQIELKKISLNGRPLQAHEYILNDSSLTVKHVPVAEMFSLQITSKCVPELNTSLNGLYKSNGMFCTQCEPEGFRKITYFPDRPDVMSKFTTTIYADKKSYPVLLANGNLVSSQQFAGSRHAVTWHDPFKKPSYLFALVAGDLVSVEDYFVTTSNRLVKLRLYVERPNLALTGHALEALKKAMAWDEKVYGREYDLDIYNIVAVDDFNMGAMENKGLNIFNSKYILASPLTATDVDYQNIDAVVAHEYFHNWSGNRVTCRDWFQLSLKEGLTVFREQQFSSDIQQSPVTVIDNALNIYTAQFPEDAGPLSHPVRPDSYIEINNFYTATVYEKGAEVIRMLHTILGPDNFRRAMDLYFARFDGQAVTCEDFLQVMQDASGIDLTQFKLWYSEKGTPEISYDGYYSVEDRKYYLTLRQHFHKVMHIPIKLGLLDSHGQDLLAPQHTVWLQEEEKTIIFDDLAEEPIPSVLRQFSAPVKVKSELTPEQLMFLAMHDSDAFTRWRSNDTIVKKVLFADWDIDIWLEVQKKLLTDKSMHPELLAEMLLLPSLHELIEEDTYVNIDALYARCQQMHKMQSKQFKSLLLNVYEQNVITGAYSFNPEAVAKRKLKNTVLNLLSYNMDSQIEALISQQFNRANNMTDEIAAIKAITNVSGQLRDNMLAKFLQKWQDNFLVLCKYFSLVAHSEIDTVLAEVKEIANSPLFNIKNPNNAYALLGGFGNNLTQFHAKDGSGYAWLGEMVLQLNDINPQVAARIVKPFSKWKKFDNERRELMKAQLVRLQELPNLSRDLYEIVHKTLLG